MLQISQNYKQDVKGLFFKSINMKYSIYSAEDCFILLLRTVHVCQSTHLGFSFLVNNGLLGLFKK